MIRLIICILAVLVAIPARAEETKRPPNILFIAVDDLRPDLGCDGVAHARSPRIDELAKRGVYFSRAYCQFPVCAPSRCSLLSGLRPTRTLFFDNSAKVHRDAPDVPSLPAHLQAQGYHTVSNGKIYHEPLDDRRAWSERPWVPQGEWVGRKGYRIAYLEEENKRIALANEGNGPLFEAAHVADNEYPDGKIAERTIDDLRRLSNESRPFFLAVGFTKPHVPFNCPKRYWDRIDPTSIPAPFGTPVSDTIPKIAIHNSPEFRKYWGVPRRGPLEPAVTNHLPHGYASCIAATDAQVGKILDELDRLDLRSDTLIVLWGDHGYYLGDHEMWGKKSLFEAALRTPLIFSGPGVPQGIKTKTLVELLDIYPTICSLAGLPTPSHTQGQTALPVRERKAVFSRHEQGESVRTDRYRYSEWTDDSGKLLDRMLFDHTSDPQETENLAEQPESAETVKTLSALLRDNASVDRDQ